MHGPRLILLIKLGLSFNDVSSKSLNFKNVTQATITSINSKIKKSIVITNAEEVEERFHSRYNCKKKTYRYVIDNSEFPTPMYRYLEYHIPNKLNIEAMKKAAKYFEGEYDFKAFKSSGTSSKSSVRTIYKAEVKKAEHNRIYIALTRDGFLYNMVRIISGTLVEVGLGKIKPEEIKNIIESKDRYKAGKTLPAHGLYLMNVNYKN